jgi:coiled-coil domain-containing protein 130
MQGFNMGRYYPPDASNLPVFNASSHPLGKRANQISRGILTVRFELPFAVWCDHCTPLAIVGQGVRFNAEKKKVGNYYSTPIWSFRMKHSACGGWWEIRTDPKNADYVVVEGAKRRDYGPGDKDAQADGELRFLTDEEKERRRNDAFANLEGKMADKGTENKNRERVEELYDKGEVWRDPYDVNARLRKGFREKRKLWKRENRHKKAMQDKFSLGIEIDNETAIDRMRAGTIEFGGSEASDQNQNTGWKPLFESRTTRLPDRRLPMTKKLTSELKVDKSRESLQQAIIGNTKASMDPFTRSNYSSKGRPTLGVRPTKRSVTAAAAGDVASTCDTDLDAKDDSSTTASKTPNSALSLVAYESE